MNAPLPACWPILIQVVFAAALALTILAVSHLFGQRGRRGKIKDTPYECGVRSSAEPIGPFSIKFYRVALLFILVDAALTLLLPWALSFKAAKAAGASLLIPGLVFLGLLWLGIAYQLKNGALEWEE
jgi:NADH-quinone oxidoreductase subunit A